MFRIRMITKTTTHLKKYVLKTKVKQKFLPAIDDIHLWLTLDPTSLYAAEVNGKPIGMIFVFKYDGGYRHSGGFYIEKKYRDIGYGYQLAREIFRKAEPTTNISAYVRNHKVEMVMKNLDFIDIPYLAEGHEFDSTIALKKLQNISMNTSYHVNEISDVDFEALVRYDKMTFGYDRKEYLYNWLYSPVSDSFVALDDEGSIVGYVVVRRSCAPEQGYRIGPLFSEDIDVGLALVKAALERIKDQGNSLSSNAVQMWCPISRNPQVRELLNFIESKCYANYSFLTSNGCPNGRVEKWFAATSFVSG